MASKSKREKVLFEASPVNFVAAAEGEGDGKKVPRFEVVAYTGVPMYLAGFELPVVVDLDGMQFARNIVANLDHVSEKRVGHVTDKTIDGGQVKLSGLASAATAAKKEVVESAADGFVWEASIEAYLEQIDEIGAGETVEVNGREVAGPMMVARKSKLVGFGFVPHGADDNTSAKIAASSARNNPKEKKMDQELRTYIEAMLPGVEVDDLPKEAVANLKKDFEGKSGKRTVTTAAADDNPFTKRKAERDRRLAIREIADKFCEMRPNDIEAIEKCHDHAIEAGMTAQEFRLELYESGLPESYGPIRAKDHPHKDLSNKVIEAAICMSGRLDDIEKHYDERTLETADKNFKGGIGLKQLWCLAAEAHGVKPNGYNVDLDVHRAAFGMHQQNGRYAQAFGFSTLSLPNILSNVANKFIRMGWNFVDQTPLEVASVRSVNDFKTITTVSLTADSQFAQVQADGEIPHGEFGEVVYTNKADTYGRMYAITRTDIINDDVGALTQVPRKLGRGAMLLLNHIFWTEFLNNSAFFTAGNNNVSTGGGSALSLAGLEAAEIVFMNQTDPDGKPLGAIPALLLVPTALKATAFTLMDSEKIIDGTATAAQGDANIWRGRFRISSSPYMSNSAYTGFSAAAWYLLADPNDIPVIEIAALNGRVEPTVETADAPFHVLGVQMRGYSDVGVNLQEFRGGVRSAGS